MIPNETDRVITGNLTGDRVRMGFDQNALAHIINILTDLYSDPELAVVREYSTNALDSHREAGNPDPIEVTLPSPLSPYLKIRDQGIGLSVDDIHEIYSKYGASTKRGSNDATGMLGLGCKSALTYSAQFTLTTVKDGVRATVAISRDEDGAGSMTIVDTSTTDAHNGVEISIPAKGGNTIERKAHDFFRFWEPGTVLVNGKAPEQIEGLQITPEITLIKGTNRHAYGGGASHVIMGNVPYPDGQILSPSTLGVPYGYSIAVRVPIGSVDFAPSREQLQYTKRTKQALEAIARTFQVELPKAIQRSIDEVATRHKALTLYSEWAKIIRGGYTFRYRGREIRTSLMPAPRADDGTPGRILITPATNYRLSAASKTTVIDLDHMASAIFVTGYDLVKLTATHKKKMLQWLDKQNFTTQPSYFVLVDFPLDRTWLNESRIVSWNTVNAEVLPKAARPTSNRLAGSYDVIVKTVGVGNIPLPEYEISGDKIDFSKPVYFMHGNIHDGRNAGTFFDNIHDAFTLICLPANRLAKFQRENPKIQKAEDVIAAEFKKWKDSITEDQMLAYQIKGAYGTARVLPQLANKTILDPEVKRAVKAAQVNVDAIVAKSHTFARWGYHLDRKEFKNPLDKYPLFSYNLPDHSVYYINLVWQSKQSS